MIERFEDIEAWKKARELTRMLYQLCDAGSFARDFALSDQLRRASISILSNIAEGFERDGTNEFRQFLSVAKGSAGEVRAQLYVALDVGYITQEQHKSLTGLAEEISRMLNGLIRYLDQTDIRVRKYR